YILRRRSPSSPTCSGGSRPRPRGTVSSAASSWPFRATMGIPVIILSHCIAEEIAQTDSDRQKERHRSDQDSGRVERGFDRLGQSGDRERDDDWRHPNEQDDQWKEQD